MAVPSSSDVFILALGVVLAAIYLFRDQLFAPSKPKTVSLSTKLSEGDGNPRDFIAKMKNGVSTLM
jgi:NADPH-ferrihemoprotein reductase